MPKVSAVVEEVDEDDEKLRAEFEEFGETVDRITDKNRPLLVKKLNHLRARRRMSEKLSQSIVKESPPAASRRGGRKRKGKSVKNESSHQTTLDAELNADEGEQLNYTFTMSHVNADVEPAIKRSTYNIPTSNAAEGPYAIARKRAVGKGQNTMQYSDKPHESSSSGATSMAQNDVPISKAAPFGQNLHLPARNDVPKRGRSRTVDDFKANANKITVSVESDSVDSSRVQKATLPVKRNARASAVASAAKLHDSSTEEISTGEGTSLSVSSKDAKVAVVSAEERGRTAVRGQKLKLSELTKSSEDVGKQTAASRIPKLARFPTPPAQRVSNGSR